MEFSVLMAAVDFIPVILFILGASTLAGLVYYDMRRFEFALFSAGTINIAAAGALKALWKLLYALGVCDFERLNHIFFPLQTLGFLLTAVGLCVFVFSKNRKNARPLAAVAVPAAFDGTMMFVALMILGVVGVDLSLAVLAKRVKKPSAAAFAVISLIFTLGMGYLSSKDFSGALMNWAAEIVNTVGQGAFLLCALSLKKAGLGARG